MCSDGKNRCLHNNVLCVIITSRWRKRGDYSTQGKTMEITYVYIILLSNNAYYIGITKNLRRRIAQHKTGRGSVLTAGADVLEIMVVIKCDSHHEARELELTLQQFQLTGQLGDFLTELAIENPTFLAEINACIFTDTRKVRFPRNVEYCKNNHLWSENTYIDPKTHRRFCKECSRISSKLSARRGLERRIQKAAIIREWEEQHQVKGDTM